MLGASETDVVNWQLYSVINGSGLPSTRINQLPKHDDMPNSHFNIGRITVQEG